MGGIRAAKGFTSPALSERQALFEVDSAVSFRRLQGGYFAKERKIGTWPMLMSPEELEKVISDEVANYSQVREIADERRREQMGKFSRDLKQVGDKAAELRQELLVESGTRQALVPDLQSSTKPEPEPSVDTLGFSNATPLSAVADSKGMDPLQPFELQMPRTTLSAVADGKGDMGTPKSAGAIAIGEQLDVYEQMRQQIDELRGPHFTGEKPTFLLLPAPAPALASQEAADASRGDGQESTGVGSKSPRASGAPSVLTSKGQSPVKELTKKISNGVDLSARAKVILGSHKTFASFSEDKFNQHLRTAERYLEQGRYYRAADAYTLASIYKPEDPLAYAGKSHALFAAGEYMSSALFLSRTFEIFPEYAQFKIDIEAMIGDRDKLDTRIVDVERWLGRSDSAELQFLLGYIYYQMGRLQAARNAIDGALEKMPEAPAVITLKDAIDNAIVSSQPAVE